MYNCFTAKRGGVVPTRAGSTWDNCKWFTKYTTGSESRTGEKLSGLGLLVRLLVKLSRFFLSLDITGAAAGLLTLQWIPISEFHYWQQSTEILNKYITFFIVIVYGTGSSPAPSLCMASLFPWSGAMREIN